jgi:glycosyltransferase involved in cell wall biosynthesis
VCTEQTGGFLKYVKLCKEFFKIRKEIDLIIVGYSGHVIVPFAKILSMLTIQKPVVFDALCSFYESNILSRDAFKSVPFRGFFAHGIDHIANIFSDYIMVETKQQKEYYTKILGVKEHKCIVALTGVNDDEFYYEPITKQSRFTVLFRGKFTPEAGLNHILEAVDLLRNEDIFFKIIGYGWGRVDDEIQEKIKKLNTVKVGFINRHLPINELRQNILECHVSLGQFEKHDRLSRTIPHKAFEALAMKIPYITAKTVPVQEILEDGKTCLFVNSASPQDIAEKIKVLRDNPTLRESLIDNGFKLYQEKLTPKELAKKLLSLLPHGY